jgi:hypothetical protein
MVSLSRFFFLDCCCRSLPRRRCRFRCSCLLRKNHSLGDRVAPSRDDFQELVRNTDIQSRSSVLLEVSSARRRYDIDSLRRAIVRDTLGRLMTLFDVFKVNFYDSLELFVNIECQSSIDYF